MRIFVTGATGFIGTAVVSNLIDAGHQVIGLCRNPEKAAALRATGAEVHLGTVEDKEDLQAVASSADGIIHLAFNHDFSRFIQNCELDRQVIATLGSALAGSNRPFVVTSGTAIAKATPGQPATEADRVVTSAHHPRAASEQEAMATVAAGINTSIVRLPQVHDTRRQGLISPLIDLYRRMGVCLYVGDGHNRWPAAHLLDVAHLYRLAIERAKPGAIYHAVDEEGIAFRVIAETIAHRLNLPVRSISPDEAVTHFGWLSAFAGMDLSATSLATRNELGWTPAGPHLLDDLANLELDAS